MNETKWNNCAHACMHERTRKNQNSGVDVFLGAGKLMINSSSEEQEPITHQSPDYTYLHCTWYCSCIINMTNSDQLQVLIHMHVHMYVHTYTHVYTQCMYRRSHFAHSLAHSKHTQNNTSHSTSDSHDTTHTTHCLLINQQHGACTCHMICGRSGAREQFWPAPHPYMQSALLVCVDSGPLWGAVQSCMRALLTLVTPTLNDSY